MSAYQFRCDDCGCFIGLDDLLDDRAVRRLITPDSEFTNEEYETLCEMCKPKQFEHIGAR